MMYRIWMKDDSAYLLSALSTDEARAVAVEYARQQLDGVSMTAQEARRTVTVSFVEEVH